MDHKVADDSQENQSNNQTNNQSNSQIYSRSYRRKLHRSTHQSSNQPNNQFDSLFTPLIVQTDDQNDGQSIQLSSNQTNNPSYNQSDSHAYQSIKQSNNQSVNNQTVNQSSNQSFTSSSRLTFSPGLSRRSSSYNLSISQSVNQPTSPRRTRFADSQSNSHTNNQSNNQKSEEHSVLYDQSIKRLISPSVNQSIDHSFKHPIDPLTLSRACFLIDCGLHGRSVSINQSTNQSINQARFVHSSFYFNILMTVIALQLMLVFVESTDSYQTVNQSINDTLNQCGQSIVIALFELLCVTFYFYDVYLLIKTFGNQRLINQRWMQVRLVVCLIMLIDLIIFLVRASHYLTVYHVALYQLPLRNYRFSRPFRPLILISRARNVRKQLSSVGNAIIGVSGLFALTAAAIIFFGLAGYFLLNDFFNQSGIDQSINQSTDQLVDLPIDHTNSFASLGQAFYALTIIQTSYTYLLPVMLPFYQTDRFSAIYFLFYQSINQLFFAKLVIAIGFKALKSDAKVKLIERINRKKIAYKQAFLLIARSKESINHSINQSNNQIYELASHSTGDLAVQPNSHSARSPGSNDKHYPITRSTSQPNSLSTIRYMSSDQSNNQSNNQANNQSNNQTISPSNNQSNTQSTSGLYVTCDVWLQLLKDLRPKFTVDIGQLLFQTIATVDPAINQSINQSFNLSTMQSINQSMNQAVTQPVVDLKGFQSLMSMLDVQVTITSRWWVKFLYRHQSINHFRNRLITLFKTQFVLINQPIGIISFIITCFTLASAVQLYFAAPLSQSIKGSISQTELISGLLLSALFQLEFFGKIFCFGSSDVLSESFNQLDFLCVISDWLFYVIFIVYQSIKQSISQSIDQSILHEVLSILITLRFARVLRVLQWTRFSEDLLVTISRVFPSISRLFLLFFLFLYFFAVIGESLFGATLNCENQALFQSDYYLSEMCELISFSDFINSFIALFHVANLSSWMIVLKAATVLSPEPPLAVSWLFFGVFRALVSTLALPLFIGVIIDTFVRNHDIAIKEQEAARAVELDRIERERLVRKMKRSINHSINDLPDGQHIDQLGKHTHNHSDEEDDPNDGLSSMPSDRWNSSDSLGHWNNQSMYQSTNQSNNHDHGSDNKFSDYSNNQPSNHLQHLRQKSIFQKSFVVSNRSGQQSSNQSNNPSVSDLPSPPMLIPLNSHGSPSPTHDQSINQSQRVRFKLKRKNSEVQAHALDLAAALSSWNEDTPIKRTTSQTINQSIDRAVTHSVNQSSDQTSDHAIDLPLDQSSSRAVSAPSNDIVYQPPIHPSMNSSRNQPVTPSINQQENRSIYSSNRRPINRVSSPRHRRNPTFAFTPPGLSINPSFHHPSFSESSDRSFVPSASQADDQSDNQSDIHSDDEPTKQEILDELHHPARKLMIDTIHHSINQSSSHLNIPSTPSNRTRLIKLQSRIDQLEEQLAQKEQEIDSINQRLIASEVDRRNQSINQTSNSTNNQVTNQLIQHLNNPSSYQSNNLANHTSDSDSPFQLSSVGSDSPMFPSLNRRTSMKWAPAPPRLNDQTINQSTNQSVNQSTNLSGSPHRWSGSPGSQISTQLSNLSSSPHSTVLVQSLSSSPAISGWLDATPTSTSKSFTSGTKQ